MAKLTFSLDDETVAALKKAAERSRKPQSLIVREAIAEYTSRDERLAPEERERLIKGLTEALGRVKKLSGLIPICSSCKKIRDDQGYWNQLEVYISEHSDASFTHSFCPECVRRLYPEIFAEPQRQT